MNPQRIGGIFLAVAGVTLFIIGMNASHSVADRVSSTFTGRFTEATTWYIVGGIASSLMSNSIEHSPNHMCPRRRKWFNSDHGRQARTRALPP